MNEMNHFQTRKTFFLNSRDIKLVAKSFVCFMSSNIFRSLVETKVLDLALSELFAKILRVM